MAATREARLAYLCGQMAAATGDREVMAEVGEIIAQITADELGDPYPVDPKWSLAQLMGAYDASDGDGVTPMSSFPVTPRMQRYLNDLRTIRGCFDEGINKYTLDHGTLQAICQAVWLDGIDLERGA